jgi:LysR family transcriptional regulator of abg operon
MITKLHQRAGHLRFRDLELVRVLAATGSLRRAAAVLGISQPMLSRRLRDVERTMGTVLWARSHRGLEVTAAGERFVAWAEALLNEMAQAQEDIRAPHATPIRIGAPPDLVLKLIPRVLSALPRQHAVVREEMLPELRLGLQRGELDAVVANCPLDGTAGESFGVEPLFHQKLAIVAAPGFAVTNSLTALSQAPWILPAAPDDLVRDTLGARFVAAGLLPPRPTYEANQLVVSLALVAQGLGLCAVPEIVVPDAEAAGQVRRVALRPAIEMPPTCLLHRRAMADHPRTRAISTAVRDVANEMMTQDRNLRRA